MDAVLLKLCDDDDSAENDEVGLKAFLKDMWRRFLAFDDMYVWQALCGEWGGVLPGASLLDARVVLELPSSGLASTMDNLSVGHIVESVSCRGLSSHLIDGGKCRGNLVRPHE
jgi:stachyose synthetase